MHEVTGCSRGLKVVTGGRGVVSHAGSALVQMVADRTGLTGQLSQALARRGSCRGTTGAGC